MTIRRRRLARAAGALIATLVLLGSTTAPVSSAAAPREAPASTAPGTVLATPTPPLVITSVTPPVATPGTTVVVTGTFTAPEAIPAAGVRVLRARASTATRSDVEAFARGQSSGTGFELGRASLGDVAAGQPVPFRVEFAVDATRTTAQVAAIPLTVEIVGEPDIEPVRTFVGLQRPTSGVVPLQVATVVPITVPAEGWLWAQDETARTSAWSTVTGGVGRATALVAALTPSTVPVTFAVDPALLGPPGPTNASDPVVAQRLPFATALASSVTTHQIMSLPYADPDLVAVGQQAGSTIVTSAVTRAASLGGTLSVPVLEGVAWPLDGSMSAGREQELRAAYGTGLRASLASVSRSTGSTILTPPALAKAPDGTAVLRWDDTLTGLLVAAQDPASRASVTQQFVAHSAALFTERPTIKRGLVLAVPRGGVSSPAALSEALAPLARIPWLQGVRLSEVLTGTGDAAPLPTPAPPPGTDLPPTPVSGVSVAALQSESVMIQAYAAALPPGSTALAVPRDLLDQLTSTRWRGQPDAYDSMRNRVSAALTGLSSSLRIAPQTTNFLADEGLLQVTVVNDLPEPVTGLRVQLIPLNPRLQVTDPGPTLTVGARSRAVVSVRMSARAQGLVPVNATLRAPTGAQLGAATELEVRANPPGVWLYIVAGSVLALVLIVGVIRSLRKEPEPEVAAAAEQMDPVLPTPERPITEPVEHQPTADETRT